MQKNSESKILCSPCGNCLQAALQVIVPGQVGKYLGQNSRLVKQTEAG